MASATMMSAIVGVLLVLLQPLIVMGDIPSAFVPPVIGDSICKGVECGKGTCKSSSSSSFLFECQCDDGWKQTHSDHDDKYSFLPCVIPNCTLDYTCNGAIPPVPHTEMPSNKSIVDACYYTDCGGGTCKSTPTSFVHTCECNEGYSNVFNTPSYPCVKQCAIGNDCKSLGVDMKNSTSKLADNGSSLVRGSISWMIIPMMFFVPFLWK